MRPRRKPREICCRLALALTTGLSAAVGQACGKHGGTAAAPAQAPGPAPTLSAALFSFRDTTGAVFTPLAFQLARVPLCDGHLIGPDGIRIYDVALARLEARPGADGAADAAAAAPTMMLAAADPGTYQVVASLPSAGPPGRYALIAATDYADPAACGGAFCNVLQAVRMAAGTVTITALATSGNGHIAGSLAGLVAVKAERPPDPPAPGPADANAETTAPQIPAAGDPNAGAVPGGTATMAAGPPDAGPMAPGALPAPTELAAQETFAADGCAVNLAPSAGGSGTDPNGTVLTPE